MVKISVRKLWSKFSLEILRDLLALIILLILSFYVVYFAPQDISKVFFLLILFFFFFLKKDYFWFAYFFIVAQGPGNFFADFSGTSLYRLPLYTFLPGFSFTPLDLFVLLALIKALIKGKRMRLNLERPLIFLLLYMIFIIVISAFIFSTNIDDLVWNARWLFFYSIIISFLFLVNKKHEVYRFVLLISPLVFFILFTQIYYALNGSEFINIFNPGYRGIILNTITGALRPLSGGTLILLFSFIFSISLIVDGDYRLRKIYLYLVVAVAFLSVFLSATRVWFVIFSFTFVGYVFISKRHILSTVGIVSICLLVVSALIYSGIIPQDLLINSSWARLRQVFDIATGNVYTVQTAMNRLVNQFPIIAGMIKQNPIIGYGFSNVTMNFYDDDFGFLNTILMFGVIGFSLFIFFFISVFRILGSTIKSISFNNPFRMSLKIMVIAWAGVLIGYFTTWDFFTMYFYKVFFVSILIAFTEFFIIQANKEELHVRQKMLAGQLPK